VKASPLLIAALTLAVAPAFGQTQTGATAQSSTSAQAGRNGANIANESAAHAAATPNQATANAGDESEISATLVKPVDARKAKPGDPVTAKTDRDAKASDGTIIKRGSTLVGHVTQASSVSGSAESTLGIMFDKAVSKDGHELPLNSSIRAIGAAQSESEFERESLGAAGGVGGSPTMTRSPGALGGSVAGTASGAMGGLGRGVGGVGGSVGTTVAGAGSLATHSPGAIGGLSASGALQSGSRGVFGLDGLDISNNVSGAAQGSLVHSSTRNVHLDGGTKILLSNSVRAP